MKLKGIVMTCMKLTSDPNTATCEELKGGDERTSEVQVSQGPRPGRCRGVRRGPGR